MNAHTGQAPAVRSALDWRTQAACLGLWDVMHPDNDENEIAAAKAVCARCLVRAECFWDSVRTGDDQHGIRAGLRANERRAVLKELQRRQQKAAA